MILQMTIMISSKTLCPLRQQAQNFQMMSFSLIGTLERSTPRLLWSEIEHIRDEQ